MTAVALAAPRGTGLAARAVPYILSILGAFLVAGIIIAIMGYNPFLAFESVLTTSFQSKYGLVETLHKWVPLVLIAMGFTIPLAAGRNNMGGEGQLLIGATASAVVGIWLKSAPTVVLLPLVLVAGVVAGALYVSIAAWLRERFGVNEILSTVLLNFVSFFIVDYIAGEVYSDPTAGHPTTRPIGAGGLLPSLGGLHSGVLLAVVVLFFCVHGVLRSLPGYELRAVGANPRAAQVHGVRNSRVAMGALIVGGAIGGLAGAVEVAGVHGKLIEGMQANYLLLGIIIGLIARGKVAVVPFVALGIAVLEVGASAMQRTAGVPQEMVLIVEALILLFLLFSDIVAVRLKGRNHV